MNIKQFNINVKTSLDRDAIRTPMDNVSKIQREYPSDVSNEDRRRLTEADNNLVHSGFNLAYGISRFLPYTKPITNFVDILGYNPDNYIGNNVDMITDKLGRSTGFVGDAMNAYMAWSAKQDINDALHGRSRTTTIGRGHHKHKVTFSPRDLMDRAKIGRTMIKYNPISCIDAALDAWTLGRNTFDF